MSTERDLRDQFDPEDWLFGRMQGLLDELQSDEARYRVREAVQLELAERSDPDIEEFCILCGGDLTNAQEHNSGVCDACVEACA